MIMLRLQLFHQRNQILNPNQKSLEIRSQRNLKTLNLKSQKIQNPIQSQNQKRIRAKTRVVIIKIKEIIQVVVEVQRNHQKARNQSKIVHLKTSTSHHQVQGIIKVKEIDNKEKTQDRNIKTQKNQNPNKSKNQKRIRTKTRVVIKKIKEIIQVVVEVQRNHQKARNQSKIVHLKTSTSHHQVQVIIKVKEIANQVIAQAINQMLLKQLT